MEPTKKYIDSQGRALFQCSKCGRYMFKESLNDHNCKGTKDIVKMIENHFR